MQHSKVWEFVKIAFALCFAVSVQQAKAVTFSQSVIQDTTSGLGNVIDAGDPQPVLHEDSSNGGIHQLWTLTADNQICNNGPGGTGLCFTVVSQVLQQASSGDTFTVTASGSGYTLYDNQAGGYLSYAGCSGTSCEIYAISSPYVWSVSGASGGGGSCTNEVDDTSPSIIYSRQNNGSYIWTGSTQSPEDFGGTEHFANLQRGSGPDFQGASVAFLFDGTCAKWIGKKGPNYGMANIYVDGTLKQTFDGYNGTELDQQANYSISGLNSGYHVMTVAILAQKNSSSSDYYQTIDAFVTDGSAVPLSSMTMILPTSASLTPSQDWQCGNGTNNPSNLSGDHCWAHAKNDTYSVSFNGSFIFVPLRPDIENGGLDYYLDGNHIAEMDTHFGNEDDDMVNAVAGRIVWSGPSGQHTLSIVANGVADPYATNSLIQLDGAFYH